jgi:glycosyltransferase involved in cell wall biosynthesis
VTSRLRRALRKPDLIVPWLLATIYNRAIHNWRATAQWYRETVSDGFKTYDRIWHEMARYRPLLAIPWRELNGRERMRRAMLLGYVSVPNLYHRLSLRRLNRLVPPAGSDLGNRSGTTVMIGSLGAGGAERQLSILMRGMAMRRARKVEVVCGTLDTPEEAFFLPVLLADGVPVKSLKDYRDAPIDPAIRAAVLKLPAAFERSIPYLAAWRSLRPQLAHLWLDETNIMGGVAAVLSGVPRIVLSQRSVPPLNFNFHKPYMRESYRWLARQPGVVMVNNSKAGATGYERWLGLRAGAIRVIHNGFEFSEVTLRRYRDGRGSYRAKLGIPADAPLVGCVFRMSEEKRPLLWLDIAGHVRRQMPDARFLMIGDGVLRAELAERAGRADLAGAVYLPGIEKDAMAAMADMDLLLLTSRIEGLPNVLIEAQAVGTPVVTTPAGGADETVLDGVTGRVLRRDDPEHAAGVIVELLRDEAWLRQARQMAPSFVGAKFSVDRSLDETLALYNDEALAKKPPAAWWQPIPGMGAVVHWLKLHPRLLRIVYGFYITLFGLLTLRPGMFLRPIANRFWNGATKYRPLLFERPDRLTMPQRIKRALLGLFLALPDPFYRRAFRRLDRAIGQKLAAGSPDIDRRGIAMMIGSLNAGGAERQVVTTLRGMQERGLGPVALACVYLETPEHRFFLPWLEAAGIRVDRIGAQPQSAAGSFVEAAIRSLPGSLRPALDYAATVAALRPRVAHFWLDEVNVKGGIAAVLAGVPRIVLSQRNIPPHNFVFHQPYMREAYRWLAKQPGVVMINNSQAGATAFEHWLGLPAGAIRVVHNGLEFTDEMLRRYRDGQGGYRAQLGIPPEAPLVGGVFRLSEEKRPLLWLDVAALVRKQMPEARFVMIGDGRMRADVTRRANRPDLAGAVYLPGVEKDSLRAMADMDLLLLASRAEGLPNVLVEAQAVGTPVVTTAVGGAPETIRHGVTGWVLADADPDHMAQTVVALLRDEAWRKKAAQEAPGFVKAKFNIDRAVDETIALYQDQPAGGAGDRW